jgi:tetratricopeptide (TPR) repeat protein
MAKKIYFALPVSLAFATLVNCGCLEAATQYKKVVRRSHGHRPRIAMQVPASSTSLISIGEKFAQFGDWANAEKRFEKAIAINVGDPTGHYNLGVAAAHLGNYEKAINQLNTAIMLKQDYIDAYVELAWVLNKQDKLDDAQAAAQKALSINPESSAAKTNLAAIMERKDALVAALKPEPAKENLRITSCSAVKPTTEEQQSLDNALNEAKAKVEADDKNVDARLKLALMYYKRGDLMKAKEETQTAIKLEPGNSIAHGNLGVILGSLGDIAGQIREEKKAITLNGADAVAYVNLGWAQARTGNWMDSYRSYKRAETLDTTCLEAKVGQGLALAKRGRQNEALALLKQLSEELPKSPLPFIAMGTIRLDRGNLDEAIKLFKQALDLEPSNMEASERLAALELKQGDWSAAAARYKELVARSAGNAECQIGLGLSLAKNGDFSGAEKAFGDAVKIAPQNASAHAGLGLSLAARGNKDEAVKEVTKALELNPKEELAVLLLNNLNKPQSVAETGTAVK